MANTVIELRHSYVTGNVPTSLANGEIAINTYDGKIFYRGGVSNTIQTIERFEGPAGLDTEIQFNDSGILGSDANLTFDKSTSALQTSNIFLSDSITADKNISGSIVIALSYYEFPDGSKQYTANAGSGGGLPAGSNQQIQFNNNGAFGASSGLTYDGSALKLNGRFESLYQSGDEGGELYLNKPATSTITDGVTIDLYQNKLRIFEAGGTNRGVFIDIANGASSGVGTDLLNPSVTPDAVARDIANAAFDVANSASVAANTPSHVANSASVAANTPSHVANSASVYANAAFDVANSASVAANTPSHVANSASVAANTPSHVANSASVAANTPSHVANSASVYANSAFNAANNEAGVNATQNTNINLAYDTANSAGVYANIALGRANNSLNANTGGIITGDVTITGNLVVSGNATTISVTDLKVDDALIQLAANNETSDLLDIGFFGHYSDDSGTTKRHTGLFRDATNGLYYLFYNYEDPSFDTSFPNNTVNIANSSFRIANLTANLISDVITIRGVDPLTQANLAFNAANNEAGVNATQNTNIQSAWNTANAAFDAANTGGGGSSPVTISIFNTTANGTGLTYDLGFSPSDANTIFVTIDGIVQPESTYTVNSSANTITFDVEPVNGENVRVVAFAQTNPYIIPDQSITINKFSPAVNNFISTAASDAAIALAIALG